MIKAGETHVQITEKKGILSAQMSAKEIDCRGEKDKKDWNQRGEVVKGRSVRVNCQEQ